MGLKHSASLCAIALLLFFLAAPPVLAQTGSDSSDAAGTLAAGGVTFVVFLVCMGLSVLLSLCITIYLAYFMYTDANARGENGVLWMVIGIFGGLLGLLVWLIIRPEKKKSVENAALR